MRVPASHFADRGPTPVDSLEIYTAMAAGRVEMNKL